MDPLLGMAYGIAGAYIGFVIGLFLRNSFGERHRGGGEPPADPEPVEPGPEDWSMWEQELLREHHS